MEKKQKFQELRAKGHTYDQIALETGYNKSAIAYYLNDTTKDKVLLRTKKIRNKEAIEKVNKYNLPRLLVARISNFKIAGKKKNENLFTMNQFYEKFGRYTKCHLTGDNIDLFDSDSHHFDHILPITRGGNNSLENLGITTPQANSAKSNLTVDEFYQLCKKVVNVYENTNKTK